MLKTNCKALDRIDNGCCEDVEDFFDDFLLTKDSNHWDVTKFSLDDSFS